MSRDLPLAQRCLALVFLLASGPTALAQSYVGNTTDIPTGGPNNDSDTENVDFADVDLDGDLDAIFADGGDCCDDQNRIWINQGFLQAGTPGVFVDETATRFPAILDESRDIEFVDFDADGDLDIFTSNSAQNTVQSSQFWVNMGGAQGGTIGHFQDQTLARWVGLGAAGSSIAPAQVIGAGGFIDFSSDGDFADLDGDGDLDLVHSSYGNAFSGDVPTRVFLNDGTGHFTEFNPGGAQLPGLDIPNGFSGLWAEGIHQNNTADTTGAFCDVASQTMDVDLGDGDGDLDVDILHNARAREPRMFVNRLSDTGTLSFRDVTHATFPAGWASGRGHYEQEWGDLDNDDDLDIYGLNWRNDQSFVFHDVTLVNDGSNAFGSLTLLAGSDADDNEGDFCDYDADGDLDLFVANASGQERLYRNDWSGGGFSFTEVTSTELPVDSSISLDADAVDVDGDGDYDLFVANEDGANVYLENVSGVTDTVAPRVVKLEQVPNRNASAAPTVVRVHVYDNAPYYDAWYNTTRLNYTVDGGATQSVPMLAVGGQLFRGEIPGSVVGDVAYWVTSSDPSGNTGSSGTLSYDGCQMATYCTAGTTANGCRALISGSGAASATAGSGFTITVTNMEAGKQGILFYGVSGRHAAAWSVKSTSFLCAKPPTQRMGVQNSGGAGAGCPGSMSVDWNAFLASKPNALGSPFSPGDMAWAQAWFRDPGSPKTTSLSDGLEFEVCP